MTAVCLCLWNELDMACSKALYQHMPGETEEKEQRISRRKISHMTLK
jgi:hypothetical protein